MSRIGNKPITVPENVEVKIDGHHIEVKGPKGTLTRDLHKNMTIVHEGNTIKVERSNNQKENRSLHGLTRTLISNMIEGVVNEYKRELEIIKMRYGLLNTSEKTQKEIAKKLGISRSYVSRIEKRSLIKMLREFIKNNN